jgi:hypothetical protein
MEGIRIDIYYAIKPLYYVSMILGLAPRSCTKDSKTKPESCWRKLWTLFLGFVQLVSAIGTMTWSINFEYPQYSLNVVIPDAMAIILLYCCALSSFVGALLHASKIREIIHKIELIDDQLIEGNTAHAYKKIRMFLVTEMVVLVLVLFPVYFYYIYVWGNGISYLYFTAHIVATFITTIFIVQYLNAVIYLKHRSVLLNKNLLSELNTSPLHEKNSEMNFVGNNCHPRNLTSVMNQHSRTFSTVTHFENTTPLPEAISAIVKGKVMPTIQRKNPQFVRINTYRKIHNELCEVASLLNASYGFTILILYTYEFLFLVSSLHYAVSRISQVDNAQYDSTSLYEVTSVLCWAAIFVITMLVITASCHFASSELHRSADIVQKLLLQQSIDSNTALELQLFSVHLLCNSVHFTAYGFFPIDFSLLCSTIGGATTFIIILLQLK